MHPYHTILLSLYCRMGREQLHSALGCCISQAQLSPGLKSVPALATRVCFYRSAHVFCSVISLYDITLNTLTDDDVRKVTLGAVKRPKALRKSWRVIACCGHSQRETADDCCPQRGRNRW